MRKKNPRDILNSIYRETRGKEIKKVSLYGTAFK